MEISITAQRRQTKRPACLVVATGTAGDVNMSLVLYVELAALTVDGIGNFVKQRLARRRREHSDVRPRALGQGGGKTNAFRRREARSFTGATGLVPC